MRARAPEAGAEFVRNAYRFGSGLSCLQNVRRNFYGRIWRKQFSLGSAGI